MTLRTVPPVGPLSAKIAVIGQAPAREEVNLGVPFVGASGRMLNTCLRHAGIRREDVFITNVFNWRLNDTDNILNLPQDLVADSLERLKGELESCEANVLVPMGNDALHALTGLWNITNWRGSIISSTMEPYRKVIPTIHPAWIIRGEWRYASILTFDLKRVNEESLFPQVNTHIIEPAINFTFNELIEVLERYNEAQVGLLVIDIETHYKTGDIRCVGIYDGSLPPVCIPFSATNDSIWNPEEEALIWKYLARVLENPRPKGGQNISFDVIHLLRHGILVNNVVFDTMHAHHCLKPELPHSLQFLTSVYTKIPFYKEEGRKWKPKDGIQALWNYNVKDLVATHLCATELADELKRKNLWDYYNKIYPRLFWTAVRMEWEGVNIDTEHKNKVIDELTTKTSMLQQSLDSRVGYGLNVRSPKQIQNFVYKEKGHAIKRSRKTHAITVDKDALEALARIDTDVATVVELRKAYDLLSDVAQQELSPFGRMHCHYSQTGAKTGRWSSSASTLGYGTNLQNIPRESSARKMFIPDSPDMIFIEADLVQAEVMYVAWEGPVETLVDLFKSGKDVHTEVARMICRVVRDVPEIAKTVAVFNCDPMEIDRKHEARYIAKRTVHASNYGLGKHHLSLILGVPEKVANHIMHIYLYVLFPEIRTRYQQHVINELQQTRRLHDPLGGVREFFGVWGNDLFREAFAHRPQRCVALTLNEIMKRCEEPIAQLGGAIRLQIHDSFIAQIFPRDVDTVKQLVLDASQIPISLPAGQLTIPIAFKAGPNWGELKDI